MIDTAVFIPNASRQKPLSAPKRRNVTVVPCAFLQYLASGATDMDDLEAQLRINA